VLHRRLFFSMVSHAAGINRVNLGTLVSEDG
jgi:hypothetical protein